MKSPNFQTGNSFTLYSDDSKKDQKFSWYWALVFAAAWYLIFYVAVIPSFYYAPDILKIKDEENHKGEFIGERAQKDLFQLASIGVKVVGSQEYIQATNYLMTRVQEIKDSARLDLYDIDNNFKPLMESSTFTTGTITLHMLISTMLLSE